MSKNYALLVFMKTKKWQAKTITRVQLLVEQSKLMAQLKREQDLKNNSLLDNDYYQPANNNHKLYVLGCVPVNMNNQPYQPRVVRKSK